MSADNWDICPRCWTEAEDDYAARLIDAAGVPDHLQQYLSIPEPEQYAFARTFRENYSITGARDGVVTVRYEGYCTVCGCRLDFDHRHPIVGFADGG